jgi:predicted Zn-dependent protease
MGHIPKRAQVLTGVVGGIMYGGSNDAAGGSDANSSSYPRGLAQLRAFAMETEREADYVGTYYVARAGYDVSAGERVWLALSQENPRQIVYAGLHPTAPERVILLQKTAREIAEKKKRHLPLDPEIKERQAAAQ